MTATTNVTKGGNCLLCPAGTMPAPVLVRLDWRIPDADSGEIDASLFLLAPHDKVTGDGDFIFYNQRQTETGSVRHLSPADHELGRGQAGFLIDIGAIPPSIARLAIGLTRHDGDAKGKSLAALQAAALSILDPITQNQMVRYEFSDDVREETALIVAALYRHATGWKFRAIGQGFVGGLPALANHFGVRLQTETSDLGPDGDDEREPVGISLQIRRRRRSPRDMLVEQTRRLQQKLETQMSQILAACANHENETRTRMILDRVFQESFGYPMENIKTEQNVQGRRADYVLSIEGQDVLVVEVKRAGMPMRGRQIFQATSYGAYAGIRWALLTNLLEWQLYRISTGDRIESNLVFTVNLKNGLDDESAYHLALISYYGLGRRGLLEKLWLKISTLGYESLVAALLNQDVVAKIRSILSRESGVSLTQDEVQAAIERNLLHLD